MADKGSRVNKVSDGKTREVLPRKSKETHPNPKQLETAVPEKKVELVTSDGRKILTPAKRNDGWSKHKWPLASPPVRQNLLPYDEVKPDESRWEVYKNRPMKGFEVPPVDLDFKNCGDPEDLIEKTWKNDPESKFAAVFRPREKISADFQSCYEGLVDVEPVRWKKSSTNDIYVNCAYKKKKKETMHTRDVLAQVNVSKTEQLLHGNSKHPTLQDVQNCCTNILNTKKKRNYAHLAPLYHSEKLQAFGGLNLCTWKTFLDTRKIRKKYGRKMFGINVPSVIVAYTDSASAVHHEDACLASYNLMLSKTGEKIFIVIHGTPYNYRRFVSALAYEASAANFGEFRSGEENTYPCIETLMRKIFFVDVKWLVTHDIKFSLIRQRPGYVVALGSLAVHSVAYDLFHRPEVKVKTAEPPPPIYTQLRGIYKSFRVASKDYSNLPLPECVPVGYCCGHIQPPISISQSDVHMWYEERRKNRDGTQADADAGCNDEFSRQRNTAVGSDYGQQSQPEDQPWMQSSNHSHGRQPPKVKKNRPNPAARRRILKRSGHVGSFHQLQPAAASKDQRHISRVDSVPVPPGFTSWNGKFTNLAPDRRYRNRQILSSEASLAGERAVPKGKHFHYHFHTDGRPLYHTSNVHYPFRRYNANTMGFHRQIACLSGQRSTWGIQRSMRMVPHWKFKFYNN